MRLSHWAHLGDGVILSLPQNIEYMYHICMHLDASICPMYERTLTEKYTLPLTLAPTGNQQPAAATELFQDPIAAAAATLNRPSMLLPWRNYPARRRATGL